MCLLNMNQKKKDIRVVEIEGKDAQDAIDKALKKLKVSRTEVEIEFLSEEHKGLFGMEGPKPAKVRVKIKDD